ncbi:hypothetical protein CPB85DRAFT_1323755, partial [Mucidula mucida]
RLMSNCLDFYGRPTQPLRTHRILVSRGECIQFQCNASEHYCRTRPKCEEGEVVRLFQPESALIPVMLRCNCHHQDLGVRKHWKSQYCRL